MYGPRTPQLWPPFCDVCPPCPRTLQSGLWDSPLPGPETQTPGDVPDYSPALKQ